MADPNSSAAQTASDGVIDLEQVFPFPLDDFQLEAIDALNQGHSVVVSAPTGSGKTLVGEYAIHRAIARNNEFIHGAAVTERFPPQFATASE